MPGFAGTATVEKPSALTMSAPLPSIVNPPSSPETIANSPRKIVAPASGSPLSSTTPPVIVSASVIAGAASTARHTNPHVHHFDIDRLHWNTPAPGKLSLTAINNDD